MVGVDLEEEAGNESLCLFCAFVFRGILARLILKHNLHLFSCGYLFSGFPCVAWLFRTNRAQQCVHLVGSKSAIHPVSVRDVRNN